MSFANPYVADDKEPPEGWRGKIGQQCVDCARKRSDHSGPRRDHFRGLMSTFRFLSAFSADYLSVLIRALRVSVCREGICLPGHS